MTKEEFRAIRKSLCLTQKGMAKLLGGYSVPAIQAWEYGVNPIPPAVSMLLMPPKRIRKPKE